MQSVLGSEHQKSQDSGLSAPCALWPVDLKLTHLDWNPEATLIHFQGQYLTICDLDYNILQGEIQNIPKTKAAVDIGEFCLVEDLASARWYRGRVQNRKEDLIDVFLIDQGSRNRSPKKPLLKAPTVRKSVARKMKALMGSQISLLRPLGKPRGGCHTALCLDQVDVS
ncbi:tudor domain-containing protein 15 isoform X2 [Xiphias gladius]|uniref:tudor domain-containing protein 15 isoform X2 n=1 Tax=Xiphias gladius TaxID=8245 RepID=UPI001A99B489|nr:tudor domain-containing protein 15 isoform X2 [Xiphias gladius]